jgi:16S rRNA (guanine1207-N2)-methyltransferase
MTSDSIKTLFLPFETGECALPMLDRGLFLRAEAHMVLDTSWNDKLFCVQSFKPHHDALIRGGFPCAIQIPPDREFDVVLLRLTKHKQESLGLIALGLKALTKGGTLHVAGAKDEGIESIEKLMKTHFGAIETRSKNHARTFWLNQPDSIPNEVLNWADSLTPKPHIEGYFTAAGMFSYAKIDTGSKLLAEHILPVIKGRVADFGAGWGYLSREVLARCPKIQKLDIYEAEANALECAKLNLSSAQNFNNENTPPSLREDLNITFNWADITNSSLPASTYDFIVMNPPFHEGKSTQVSLGQGFIQSASKAMKPGGRLFMVANRQLPYEAILKTVFSNVKILADEGGFKVYDSKR